MEAGTSYGKRNPCQCKQLRSVQLLITPKFRLNVDVELNLCLSNYAGGCRFLWNKTLALNLSRLENKQKILWYQELSFWTTLWKRSVEYGFLREIPSQALQQKL